MRAQVHRTLCEFRSDLPRLPHACLDIQLVYSRHKKLRVLRCLSQIGLQCLKFSYTFKPQEVFAPAYFTLHSKYYSESYLNDLHLRHEFIEFVQLLCWAIALGFGDLKRD